MRCEVSALSSIKLLGVQQTINAIARACHCFVSLCTNGSFMYGGRWTQEVYEQRPDLIATQCISRPRRCYATRKNKIYNCIAHHQSSTIGYTCIIDEILGTESFDDRRLTPPLAARAISCLLRARAQGNGNEPRQGMSSKGLVRVLSTTR